MARPSSEGQAFLEDFLCSGQYANPVSSVVDCGLTLAFICAYREDDVNTYFGTLTSVTEINKRESKRKFIMLGEIHCAVLAPTISGNCHSSGSFPVSLRQQVDPS